MLETSKRSKIKRQFTFDLPQQQYSAIGTIDEKNLSCHTSEKEQEKGTNQTDLLTSQGPDYQ